jgi:hypothetical protein
MAKEKKTDFFLSRRGSVAALQAKRLGRYHSANPYLTLNKASSEDIIR